MKLSIIIVSWNTRELLAACLESILTHSPACDFDVWVVDNASSDGSAELVRERYPQVRVIANRDNVGFARANNQAIRQCAGDYVLLLNPDTEVTQDALDQLVRFLDRHPHVGAVGPRLINADGSLQTSCYPAPTLFREFWRLFNLDSVHSTGNYPMADWDLQTPREVDVIKGACLLLRRDVIDDAGVLDEGYFMYSEEVDWCRRIRSAGWPLYWLPQAVVVHYEGQSTRQLAAEMFLQLYRGKIIYFRKNHGRLSASVYKLLLFNATLARLACLPLTLLQPAPQRHQNAILGANYRRLLTRLPEL